MRRFSPFSFLAFLVFITGCEIINPPEEAPAYITIREPEVILDESTGFSSSAGIRDVWFYHSGFLQGVYPINAAEDPNGDLTIPYINISDTSFFVKGGILETGLSSFRLPYPFWDDWFFFVEQGVGDTAIVTPRISYIDESDYTVATEENFEGISFGLVPFNRSLTNEDSTHFVRDEDSFMGNYSGRVDFSADQRYFEVINASPFTLERANDIYAEITYRTNMNFQVGLVYLGAGGLFTEEVVTITPKGEWNTIYVHLIQQVREIINNNGEFTNFWLWIFADGVGNDGYIYLDNVRVIHEN